MINVRLQIGDGTANDTFKYYKLIYLSSDHRTEAPIKARDTSSHPGEAGEHIDPRTVQDAFDYKVIFAIDAQSQSLVNINRIIADFNSQLYTQETGSNIRTYKEVTFYNDFKSTKIVGYPEPIAECKELCKTQNDHEYAQVELTIRVSDPSKCEFNTLQTSAVISASDLFPNWYNSTGRGGGLYYIPDSYLYHIIIPCKSGTIVKGHTVTYGAAPEWLVRDKTTGLCLELYKDSAHTGTDIDKTFAEECEFIIQFDSRKKGQFYCTVDNTAVEATAMITESALEDINTLSDDTAL